MKNKWRGSRIRCLCACAASVMLLSGCTGTTQEPSSVILDKEEETISYTYATVQKGDVEKTTRVACTYKQMKEQQVSFAVSGKLVDKILVNNGDVVKKGDLLAELSSDGLERNIADVEYRIKRNEMQLEFLDTNENNDLSGIWYNKVYYGMSDENLNQSLESTKKSYEYQRQDLNDSLELDRQLLNQYKADLKASRVYAEMDGVVYNLKERLKGTTSKKDAVIMVIADTSDCLFETKNPGLKDCLKPTDSVRMLLSYGTGAGTYMLMPYNMEEWGDTQLFAVVESPEGAVIQVGASGTMYVIADRKQDVLNVPSTCVHIADGKAFVYVVGNDGMREMKWIEIGLVGDTVTEIVSGLAEGEKVILK